MTVKDLDAKLSNHMLTQRQELAQAVADILKKSFPEGDPDGHRRHHEAVIKLAEERAEFWQRLRIALATWGMIGFIGWSLIQLWTGLIHGPAVPAK